MWQVIARSLFGVALLAGVVAYVEPSRLIASTESLRLEWLATAVLLGFGGILIQWWKWAQLSRLLPRRFTPSQVSRTLFGGFVLGMMSPGRVGEFGRAVFVDDQHRSVSALTALDRAVSATFTMVAGALAVGYCFAHTRWPLVISGTIGVLLAVRYRSALRDLAARYDLADMTKPDVGRRVLGNAIGALTFNGVFFSQLYCLLAAGADVPAAAVAGIPMVFAAKTLLPLAPMDIGVRETAAVFVLGHFGVDVAVALQASLLLFLINVLLPGLIGVLLVSGSRWQGVSLPSITRHRYPTP
ncbi:MAG: hypothetical protein CME24_11590 [Gemmatimonadetes bacterium]|nr:hypothetical protein [Gemmatimonadota bacterium]